MAVLPPPRPYHRKQHSLIRAATPPPANEPFGARPASSAAECEEGFMDLGAPVVARPSSRCQLVQPAEGALYNTGSAEVGAGFGLATGYLRCSVGSHVDPAYAKPTPSRGRAIPVELATADILCPDPSKQAACRKLTALRAGHLPPGARPANAYSLGLRPRLVRRRAFALS